MCSVLEQLHIGNDIPACDEDDDKIDLFPENLDIDKFNRGRDFFKRNIGQCLMAMLFSLVCGLSIKRFLDVLVCTGKTSTPTTALKRYLDTVFHLIKWHYGNVWDSTSQAYQSICSVRSMHKSARQLMRSREDHMKYVYLSQYDMGLVQCGFMGAIIMYPDKLGLKCSKDNLDDYVYFWRWIGYLLGVNDEYNICMGGYDNAYKICKAIDKDILIRSLDSPPINFYPMAKAFIDGTRLIGFIPWFTVESIVARYYQVTGARYPYPVSITNWIRIYALRLYLASMYYFPTFASMVNSTIEKSFQCHRFC